MVEGEPVVAIMSGPNAELLLEIGESLVEEGMAACVTVIDAATSVYGWEGKVARDREAVAFVKTVRTLVDDVAARVRDLHPYEIPEFIVLPVVGGDPSYLDWMLAATTHESTEEIGGSS